MISLRNDAPEETPANDWITLEISPFAPGLLRISSILIFCMEFVAVSGRSNVETLITTSSRSVKVGIKSMFTIEVLPLLTSIISDEYAAYPIKEAFNVTNPASTLLIMKLPLSSVTAPRFESSIATLTKGSGSPVI